MTEQESVNKALYFVESGILSAEEDIIGGCEDEYSRTSLNVLLVCKEALEKQIAKKPYQIEYETEYGKVAPVGICGVPYKLCPICNTLVWGSMLDKKKKYCYECGQKLNWEEEDD